MEKRVKALEVGAHYEATQKDVKAVETEFLGKLKEIKATMVKESKAGAGGASSKEVQTLKEENEMLKKRNAKLEYRVQHMLKHLEDFYNQQKQ